ncbi:MAG: DUF4625 domain-containing protein [Bacteroidota bacterium]|nr:DUF4625 domain-containing protein [Bacteroidota bacterium]
MKSTFYILALNFFIISSCKKTDDIKPEIIVESPINKQTFRAGEEIIFKAIFKDNDELAQYKIDIHNNFDGHSHVVLASEAWEEVIIEELSGVEQKVERKLIIPADATIGDYDFIVKCIDVSGNEATLKSLGIIIEN